MLRNKINMAISEVFHSKRADSKAKQPCKVEKYRLYYTRPHQTLEPLELDRLLKYPHPRGKFILEQATFGKKKWQPPQGIPKDATVKIRRTNLLPQHLSRLLPNPNPQSNTLSSWLLQSEALTERATSTGHKIKAQMRNPAL